MLTNFLANVVLPCFGIFLVAAFIVGISVLLYEGIKRG